ncbi:MAG TPA: peptidylprolyl isomerase [bacterium]|nr:peptidylprolyl isomerase [bacterium]
MAAAAPETFKVKFETSKGDFVMEVHRPWSPHGADRLYYLANNRFYEGVRFFRVINGFMAQFGYHGDPEVSAVWSEKNIPDDPVVQSNKRGYVTYAKSAMPNSRSTQLFINFNDNSFLDNQGFSPVGKIIEGMEVVDQLYAGYGDGPPRGSGPNQQNIRLQGNKFLIDNFPKLDYIKKAYLISE